MSTLNTKRSKTNRKMTVSRFSNHWNRPISISDQLLKLTPKNRRREIATRTTHQLVCMMIKTAIVWLSRLCQSSRHRHQKQTLLTQSRLWGRQRILPSSLKERSMICLSVGQLTSILLLQSKRGRTSSSLWCPCLSHTLTCEQDFSMVTFLHIRWLGWSAMISSQQSSSAKRVRLRRCACSHKEQIGPVPKTWRPVSKIASSRASAANLRRPATISSRLEALMSPWRTSLSASSAASSGKNESVFLLAN